jgi:hypothetical protein
MNHTIIDEECPSLSLPPVTTEDTNTDSPVTMETAPTIPGAFPSEPHYQNSMIDVRNILPEGSIQTRGRKAKLLAAKKAKREMLNNQARLLAPSTLAEAKLRTDWPKREQAIREEFISLYGNEVVQKVDMADLESNDKLIYSNLN